MRYWVRFGLGKPKFCKLCNVSSGVKNRHQTNFRSSRSVFVVIWNHLGNWGYFMKVLPRLPSVLSRRKYLQCNLSTADKQYSASYMKGEWTKMPKWNVVPVKRVKWCNREMLTADMSENNWWLYTSKKNTAAAALKIETRRCKINEKKGLNDVTPEFIYSQTWASAVNFNYKMAVWRSTSI